MKKVQPFKYYEVGFCDYLECDEKFQNMSVTNKRSDIYITKFVICALIKVLSLWQSSGM